MLWPIPLGEFVVLKCLGSVPFKCYLRLNESSAMQAIQTAEVLQFPSSNFRRELKHLPCGLHVKQPAHVFRLLVTNGRNQKPRTLGFAVPNGNNKAERDSSHDDPVLVLSKNNKSSKDLDVEGVASSSHSQANSYPNSEQPGSQGTLLDKLRAVHLHVLASEQWNASLLKLCHRYILVTFRIQFIILRIFFFFQPNANLLFCLNS